ncbi:hypothetical protein IFT73_08720 [Aeromicrobium sp. CFBP 8757]|uniref:hypothetical protein n=1 Tax=Aeromicrobium sp. CFBP 8757 TaxID=2775288 RepID=UPI001781C166|nr:hypothetical protein [Aeromicrobium sp. CFBP 8757]MBD8606935.1 hypothetical protein [Aeromicrobium sp. CFBP 8757]
MTRTATRRSGAVAGIGALVASALVLAPAAQAATTVNVTNAEVKPTAAVYTAWHQGYDNNPTGAKVTVKGLELSNGPSQVIKGYADNDATIAPNAANRNFDLASKITAADFTTTVGTANLQVPLRSTAIAGNQFATIRSLDDDGSRIKLTDEWASSKAIGSIPANQPTPLRDIIAALGPDYKVIGFGVQSDKPATVTDITWDGTTYTFKEPVVQQVSAAKFYKFSPKSGKITTKNTVNVYVQVTVDGKQAPRGLKVDGYAKGKKVASGTVNSIGKIKLSLGKLPKGKSTLKVTVVGTDTIKPVSISRAVTVKK